MQDQLPVAQQQGAVVVAGFGTADSFAFMQRVAQMLASSSIVPEQFSIFKNGKLKPKEEHALAVANAAICVEMSMRMNESPLAVAQSLYIVSGRPGWSSQFLIAKINTCGKFSHDLHFDITDPEPEREVETQTTEWVNGNKQTKTITEKIKNRVCVAWTTCKTTGKRLESIPVSFEMAVKEGWMSKAGSKWKVPGMDIMMLQYRAATFFSSLYCPELKLGMRTAEELHDIIDITPEPAEPTKAADIAARFGADTPVVPTKKVEPAKEPTEPVKEQAKEPAKYAKEPAKEKPKAEQEPVKETPPLIEEEIKALQEVYNLLAELARITGEYADDLLHEITNGKVGCQAELEGKSHNYVKDLIVTVQNEIIKKREEQGNLL